MKTLETLLGEKYNENLTLEQVDNLLSELKIVSLASGDYVAKGKFEALQKKLDEANANMEELQKSNNELVKKTEDYDSLKQQNTDFVTKEKKGNFKKIAKEKGIDEKFLNDDDYIDILYGKYGEAEDIGKTLDEYLENHSQYKIAQQSTTKIDSGLDLTGKTKGETDDFADLRKA